MCVLLTQIQLVTPDARVQRLPASCNDFLDDRCVVIVDHFSEPNDIGTIKDCEGGAKSQVSAFAMLHSG